jgi:hypothetical protein
MASNRAVIHGIEGIQKIARQKDPEVEFGMPEIATSREAPKEGIWEQKTGRRKVGPDGGGTFTYWERQPDIEQPDPTPQQAAAPAPEKPEITPERSETFESQIPDQTVNSRNAIEEFNQNYSQAWSEEAASNDSNFMEDYNFAGANSESTPKWNGSNMKVSMTTNWEEGAEDQSVEGGQTNFKYANARDRANSYSNQKAGLK